MRPLFLFALCLLFTAPCLEAQVLGVIGSSTAAGGGASKFDSSWVGRTALFYTNLGQLTAYHDIALSATVTWQGMPSSFTPPTETPQPPSPDPTLNVTRILQLGSDVVVIAYPSNDIVNGFTLTQFLSNLRVIYDSIEKTGKAAYVTTTQPRSDQPMSIRQMLLVGRDSILNEFQGRALNFWDPVTDPSTLGILSQYNSGDGIHFNDAGHAVLAQVAENANIMTPAPLALTLTAFGAKWTGQNVLLHWSATDDVTSPLLFDIQRSSDGATFFSLYQTTATSAASGSWSWTDSHCPSGTSFYRLRWTEDAEVSYSKIIAVNRPTGALSIDKLYLSGTSWLVSEVALPSAGTASISVLDFNGRLILQKEYSGLSTSATLSIPLPALANGEYVLKIITPDGQATAKPFVKF